MMIGLLPRIILDYYYFKNPIYSFIRYVGCNFAFTFLGNSNIEGLLSWLWNIFLLLFIVSPLIFTIYRINFKKYKKFIIFLSISLLIFIVRLNSYLKLTAISYFIVFVPLIVLLIAKSIKEKELKWHCVISILIIVFLTWNFFIPNEENLINSDLQKIISEHDVEYIIAGPYDAVTFAAYTWDDKPEFVWFQDFVASKENRTEIRKYNLDFDSQIPLKNKLVISASFNRFNEVKYDNYILVLREGQEPSEEFALEKCYDYLCVYTDGNYKQK